MGGMAVFKFIFFSEVYMKSSQFNVLIVPNGASEGDLGSSLLINTLHDHRITIDNADGDPAEFFKKIRDHAPLTADEEAMAKTCLEMEKA